MDPLEAPRTLTREPSRPFVREQRAGEVLVSEWEANLTAISQTSLDAVVIVDTAGIVRGWNRHAEQIFGWSADEAIGQPAVDLIVPSHLRDDFFERFEALAAGRESDLLERRYERDACRKDRSIFPIEVGIMRTAPDSKYLYVCFIRDLTLQRHADEQIAARTRELEKAQERLRESEQIHRHVIELSNLFPWTADVHGNILSMGARWEEWTGTPITQAVDRQWVGTIHPDDRIETIRRWEEALASSSSFDMEWRVRRADGGYRWLRARGAKGMDASGKQPIWYGTLEDVHDRRAASDAVQHAQAELVHVARLNAMGAMGSAIAHDLNQPLTAITHYVRGCKKLLASVPTSDHAEINQALDDADRSALRAGDIVRRVREFVARGQVKLQTENIVELVESACKLGLIDAGFRGVAWRTEYGKLCRVTADRVQMLQVLINLIQNAVEAMAGQPVRELVIRTDEAPPGFCEVSVSDTGLGLTAEKADRMFDPFFTTRPDGTGIGLSISRMIVQAHGGAIWHEPRPGQGTVIKFTLPSAGPEAGSSRD